MIKRSLRELIYPLFYKKMSGIYKKEKSEFDPFEFTQSTFSSFAKEFSFADLCFRPGVHNEQKTLFIGGHILQRIENWASASFEKKLEYSYPLLDKRIVEFALAVPEELYARKEGHSRYLFKSAISDFLPKNIVWEVKFLGIEYDKILKSLWDEALRLWMKKNEKTPERKNSYIDRAKIMQRIKKYFKNKENREEDKLGRSRIVTSILISNLKNKYV